MDMSACIDFWNHKITEISTRDCEDARCKCNLYPASTFINLVKSRGSIYDTRLTLIYATLFLFQKKKTCAKRKIDLFGKAFFLKERSALICVYNLFFLCPPVQLQLFPRRQIVYNRFQRIYKSFKC